MKEQTILKYLNKTASQRETNAVEKWIAEKEAHREEFERLKTLWEMSEQLSDYQTFDTKAAWNKIEAAILEEESNTSNLKVASKRTTSSNLNNSTPKSNRSFVLRMAAAFLVFLMAGLLFFALFPSDTANSGLTYKTVESKDNLLKVPLSDGSIVFLNQNSTLKYPIDFSADDRTVMLTGEAFFEVAENPQKPFVIEAGDTNVKVLGTSFNVNSNNQEHIEVTVASGKVQFYSKEDSKEMVILEKDEKGLYENKHIRKDINEDSNFLSWKTGVLKFKNESLSQLLAATNRHYGVNIQIDSSSPIADCEYTSKFEQFEVEEILQELEDYFGFSYSKTAEGYVLKGEGCE